MAVVKFISPNWFLMEKTCTHYSYNLKKIIHFNIYMNKSSSSLLPVINITVGKLAIAKFGIQEILLRTKVTFLKKKF